MQLFKSLYFGVGAASRHYDLIQLSQMVQSTYFITYEFFCLLQGSEKKSYFLKVFKWNINNWCLDNYGIYQKTYEV